MSRWCSRLSVSAVVVLLAGSAIWGAELAAGGAAARDEREPPAAQVPTMVVGQVVSVDVEAKTFTVMSPAQRRRPAGEVVIGIGRDTTLVRNELVPASTLKVGEVVKLRGKQPAPVGLPIYAQGEVAQLVPLTVAVSEEVQVVVRPGAELLFVRASAFKLEELRRGMEVQVMAWTGEEPLLATEVQSFQDLTQAQPQSEEETPPTLDAEPERGTESETK